MKKIPMKLNLQLHGVNAVNSDYKYLLDLDLLLETPTSTPNYAEIADCESVELNTTGDVEDYPVITSIYRRSNKTAVNTVVTFTCKRNDTDPTQIAVAATQFYAGERCKTNLQITDQSDVVIYTIPVVINVTQGAGGAGNANSVFSFTAQMDGDPTIA